MAVGHVGFNFDGVWVKHDTFNSWVLLFPSCWKFSCSFWFSKQALEFLQLSSSRGDPSLHILGILSVFAGRLKKSKLCQQSSKMPKNNEKMVVSKDADSFFATRQDIYPPSLLTLQRGRHNATCELRLVLHHAKSISKSQSGPRQKPNGVCRAQTRGAFKL